MQNSKRILVIFGSIIYGSIIGLISNKYSFDFDALVNSVEYYRFNGFEDIFEILFNNTILLIIWDKPFEFLSAGASVALLYGFASFLRFYVYFTIFNPKVALPVFLSTAVVMDLNTCRFSLVFSLSMLFISKSRKYLIVPAAFIFHVFTPVGIFLLKRQSYKLLISILVVILLYFVPSYFTRHFADLGDVVTRIVMLYFVFSLILVIYFYEVVREYLFNYFLLIFSFIFLSFIGTPLGAAYYFRVSDIIFETILVHIMGGIERPASNLIKSYSSQQYLVLYFVTGLSTIYSLTIIGGNIWRFF